MDDTVRLSRSARRYISGITDSGCVVVTRYAPDPSSRPNRLTDGEDDRAEAISDEVPWRSLNFDGFRAPESPLQVFRGVDLHNPTLVDHRDPVAKVLRLLQDVVVKKIVRPCRTRSFR